MIDNLNNIKESVISRDYSAITTLESLKKYLMIDHDQYDDYLNSLIVMVEDYVESKLHFRLTSKVFSHTEKITNHSTNIILREKNIQEVIVIKRNNNTIQSTEFTIDIKNNVINFNYILNPNDVIYIEYKVGENNIPATLKYAILNHISYCYENRNGKQVQFVPDWIQEIYNNHSIIKPIGI